MKKILGYIPTKDERKVKRTINVSIGFIGILLVAGILFTVLLLNSSSAVPSTSATDTGTVTTPDSQNLNANTAPDGQSLLKTTKEQRKAVERLKAKRDLPAERKAAAERYKKAGVSVEAGISAIAATLPTTGMDPGGLPHYFGPYPNYANSPMPTVTLTGITPTTVGNPVTERTYATDNANNVFVVVSGVLPTGTVENLQIWNQAFSTGSPPSAGNSFHAYVLRPTGTANQYTVIFDSGLLTVPALTTAGVSEVAAFTMPSVPVQANDVIGFYGNGIPLDIEGV